MLLYMPTKVYSEKDCVKNHAKEFASFGKRAMVVTGKYSARKSGALQDIEEVLQQENISHVLFDEIEENPSIETVM
ncbi:MAG: iron-containing alcohol dehydrogenase, partial [Lachnospiraceae bacterium]|nr:iron-containing alcohol dehydrogenase [Lachnospiraceae bacterium]